jgi:type IX secretion system PorP/SprF family membrane protein
MQSQFKITTLFILLITSVNVFAQTPYSSQNFNATNFLNPASVGFGINNKFQTFYRNQFSGVSNPYRTIGIGLDIGLLKTEANEGNNNFGMGIQVVSEQVMNGILQTNAITLSFADRIFLNELKTSHLALGISATLITRTIDGERLTFGDQYNSGRLFNSASMEVVNAFPSKYSTNAGIMYTYSSEKMFLQIGGSVFFINRSANTQVDEKLEQTYQSLEQTYQSLAMINFEKIIGEDKTILFHADYQKRVESEYYYTGAALGLPLYNSKGKMNRMYIGCFYRSKEAVIPYVGLLYNKYKFGLSYDIYQSSIPMSSLHPQTFEFTLSTYLGRRTTENLISLFN